jgi:transcriptional regulator with XRE-family HTH domain
MKKDIQSIGDRLRGFRLERGYSQEFVASKLKLTQQAYAAIEKNPENSSLKRLYSVCEILEVDIAILLGIVDIENTINTSVQAVNNFQKSCFLTTQLTLNINDINKLSDLEHLVQMMKKLMIKNESLKRSID